MPTHSWLADLTDVTLVSDDTQRRLDLCDSGKWGYLLETWLVWLWSDAVHSLTQWWLALTWLMWPWWVMIPLKDFTDDDADDDADSDAYADA